MSRRAALLLRNLLIEKLDRAMRDGDHEKDAGPFGQQTSAAAEGCLS
jgi:hypothetical protein